MAYSNHRKTQGTKQMYVVGNKVKTVYGLLEIVKVNKTSVICDLHGDKIKVMFRQLDIMNK